MILTITNTTFPADNLSYLLHKHPDKLQSVELAIGRAHIFYPQCSEQRTTAALLLDIDPIDMVRGASRNLAGRGFSLGQYVNDRPYVASSFMSVALSKAFATAMNARCSAKPELVDQPLALEVSINVLPVPRGGAALLRRFFEPLGYDLELQQHILDGQFPQWGDSKHFSVVLKNTITLSTLLTHLYVLIPSLDNDKHYFVSNDEIDKLLSKGQHWLSQHPAKEEITRRYLINLKSLSRQAIEQLTDGYEQSEHGDTTVDDHVNDGAGSNQQVGPLTTASAVKGQRQAVKENLHQQRLNLALEKILASGAQSVIDLGCGEGKLLRMLIKQRQFNKITGMDIAHDTLLKAKQRLHWDDMAPRQKERINLFQGALTYRDQRLSGYHAAALVEVIEHLEEDRLPALERVLFEFAQPTTVVLSTPNVEYNAVYEGFARAAKTKSPISGEANITAEANGRVQASPQTSGEKKTIAALRHDDHRFEWTRQQFESWAQAVAHRNHYQVSFFAVGEQHETFGAPSQMAVFTRNNGSAIEEDEAAEAMGVTDAD